MKKLHVLFLLLVLACTHATAQQNYKMHSMFMFSFTRYVIWPEAYNEGDFEILVLGDTPMKDALQDMANLKKVNERKIKVTKINNASEIRKCNILFVSASKSSQLKEILAKVNTQSILVVTEEPGLATQGSHINFVERAGRLAFELNQAAINKNNLKVANELSRVAIII